MSSCLVLGMSRCRDVEMRDVEMSRCRERKVKSFVPERRTDLLQAHENGGMATKVFTVFLLSSCLFFRAQAVLERYLPV